MLVRAGNFKLKLIIAQVWDKSALISGFYWDIIKQ